MLGVHVHEAFFPLSPEYHVLLLNEEKKKQEEWGQQPSYGNEITSS